MNGREGERLLDADRPAHGDAGRPGVAVPLNYFAPVPDPFAAPLAKVADAVPAEPGRDVSSNAESADEPRTCAFESFVNVVGTLLVVATVLLLLADRVRPIFLAKP